MVKIGADELPKTPINSIVLYCKSCLLCWKFNSSLQDLHSADFDKLGLIGKPNDRSYCGVKIVKIGADELPKTTINSGVLYLVYTISKSISVISWPRKHFMYCFSWFIIHQMTLYNKTNTAAFIVIACCTKTLFISELLNNSTLILVHYMPKHLLHIIRHTMQSFWGKGNTKFPLL